MKTLLYIVVSFSLYSMILVWQGQTSSMAQNIDESTDQSTLPVMQTDPKLDKNDLDHGYVGFGRRITFEEFKYLFNKYGPPSGIAMSLKSQGFGGSSRVPYKDKDAITLWNRKREYIYQTSVECLMDHMIGDIQWAVGDFKNAKFVPISKAEYIESSDRHIMLKEMLNRAVQCADVLESHYNEEPFIYSMQYRLPTEKLLEMHDEPLVKSMQIFTFLAKTEEEVRQQLSKGFVPLKPKVLLVPYTNEKIENMTIEQRWVLAQSILHTGNLSNTWQDIL